MEVWIPEFRGAASLSENTDGTIAYSDYGFGALFIPSGLGYFNQSQSAIPSYSNLIFKIELFNTLPLIMTMIMFLHTWKMEILMKKVDHSFLE